MGGSLEIKKWDEVNMGEAWQELLQDKLNEGKIEGEAIGIEKSIISSIRVYLKRNMSRSFVAELISEIFDGHEMTDAEYEKALAQL